MLVTDSAIQFYSSSGSVNLSMTANEIEYTLELVGGGVVNDVDWNLVETWEDKRILITVRAWFTAAQSTSILNNWIPKKDKVVKIDSYWYTVAYIGGDLTAKMVGVQNFRSQMEIKLAQKAVGALSPVSDPTGGS